MAKKTVGSLPKRDPKKPLGYVGKNGDAMHFRRGQKKSQHSVLAKKVVGKDLLKARKAGKIILFLEGRKVKSAPSALRNRGKKRLRRRGR